MCWLASWLMLVGWSVGRLVGWLVGGWWAGWLVGQAGVVGFVNCRRYRCCGCCLSAVLVIVAAAVVVVHLCASRPSSLSCYSLLAEGLGTAASWLFGKK